MSTRPGPLRRVLALVLGAVLLAGCATLPRSGPVTASDPDVPAPQGIEFFASGPQPGASPEEIVDGFLAASVAGYSPDNNFVLAREFLTGPVADTWEPLEQVRVYADAPAPLMERTDDGGVRVSVASAASLDAVGRYTESVEGATIEADFTLARNADGEWRIAELDDGVLLPLANFHSIYTEGPLYFLTPDHEALVPELRWFPQENLSTSLIGALLDGPSPWLDPGVSTAVPVGTRMVVESVAVTDGVAHVDLSADSIAAEGRQRSLLYAQILATLATVPDVQDVEVTAAGAPFELEEPPPDLTAYPYTAAGLTAVQDGTLVDVNGGDVEPRPGSELLADMNIASPAVGYETQAPTTVVLDGPNRLVSAPPDGNQPILLFEGTDLVAPSVDRHGWAWTTPAENTGTLRAVLSSGAAVDIAAPWLAGGEVRALRVSRDGARVAVIWESSGNVVLDIAAVEREPDGTPEELGDPVRLGEVLTDAIDLAWVEEDTVAVLGTSSVAPEPTVHLVPIGGPTSALPVVEGSVDVTAGRGDRSLVLATDDGRLYERNGAGWRTAFADMSDPALPG